MRLISSSTNEILNQINELITNGGEKYLSFFYIYIICNSYYLFAEGSAGTHNLDTACID